MNNAPPLDIIYLASIDWNSTWQRPQQIASRLARHGRLLYVSPFGLRSADLRDWERVLRRVLFRVTLSPAKQTDDRLTVYTPLFYLPFPENPLAERINAWLLARVLRSWIKRLNVTRPIVWIGSPSALFLGILQKLNPRRVVYDCMDNFAFFHPDQSSIVQIERNLASRADLVLATAEELRQRMVQINPNTVLMPNAADFEHFSRASRPILPIPNDIASIPQPILGYFGELAEWFDFDLVHDLAVSNSNWSIVLIGQAHVPSIRKLLQLPNIAYLGRKNYADLPAYLSRFDVCLLPFLVNALTAAVNPVKLYEYLAAGKPVVSTRLREVAPYDGTVEIADRKDFSSAVRRVLETSKEPALMRRRQEIARRNTWDHRVEEILRILNEPLEGSFVPGSARGEQ